MKRKFGKLQVASVEEQTENIHMLWYEVDLEFLEKIYDRMPSHINATLKLKVILYENIPLTT